MITVSVAQMVKNPLCNAGDLGSILGQEDPMEEEMTNSYSSILVWESWNRESWSIIVHMGCKKLDMTEQLSLHFKYSYHLSTYKVVTVLLTISLVLYIIFLWLVYHRNFIPLNPLHLFNLSPDSSPFWNHQFILCIYESVLVLFVHLFCFLLLLLLLG